MTSIGRARFRTLMATVILAPVMFVAAGTVRWLPLWLYLAVLVASTMGPLWGPLRLDDGLIEERVSYKKTDMKAWDRAFMVLLQLFTLAELVVPGLDHRFGWTPAMPRAVMWVGFAGVVAATAGIVWAMTINRFFSTIVRIQTDRGHRVITAGPYRVVRHPGYAFWMAQAVSVPLLFGSLWTYVPVGLLVAIFFVRTALEDRVLHEELDGYRDYAAQVCARLIPGVW